MFHRRADYQIVNLIQIELNEYTGLTHIKLV